MIGAALAINPSEADEHAFLQFAYRRMQFIRQFEQRCFDLSKTPSDGSIQPVVGSVHLCAGQEAVPVGAMAALRNDDRVVATYRGHGWALEAGLTAEAVLAEICHRANGVNGGRAGSAYFMAPASRFIGENSIVGAGVPIACGLGLAALRKHSDQVCIVSFGDGAMNQGAVHEGFVFAVYLKLPVIFVCENNGWSELTPTSRIVPIKRLARRAIAYGMEGITVDGNDPVAVRNAVAAAAAKARSGQGPTLIEASTVRLWGHYNRDIEHYRPREDRRSAQEREPVVQMRARLLDGRAATPQALELVDAEVTAEIEAVTQTVLALPLPDSASARLHVFAEFGPPARMSPEGPFEEMSYAAAINAALRTELAERPEVVVYGEDVGHAGGIFGITKGLQKQFGAERVFDTPISESAILGSAVGSAIDGLRPIVEIMWADFLLVALDQLINQAANVRYVTRGNASVPMVMRTQQGATPGSCPQHSQSLEALLAHIPGLCVGLPSTPQDAYSMLRAAVEHPDPVMLFEARALYQQVGQVAVTVLPEAVGGARLRRPGRHLAIVCWGPIMHAALAAAERLAVRGIDAAVLDLRWLCPLDDEALDAAVAGAGGNVLVVHEANKTGGFGAEIVARLVERHGKVLTIKRLATPDTRIPASPVLQSALLPSTQSIIDAAVAIVEQSRDPKRG